MKTVIGFDSWTLGASHFERLVPAFKEKGYTLLLIHIGSWGHDKNRPKEEMIGKLLVRDISYYGKKSVIEIIEQEDPIMVLFLSTHPFAHMTFNRYVHYKGIPTCHLYHGLVNVQAVNSGEKAYRINYVQHCSLLISRSFKNIFRLIPFYCKSLVLTSASLRIWMIFWNAILGKVIGRYFIESKFLADRDTTIGCVYTHADVEHMHRNYRVSLDKIYVVGNPDISSFHLMKKDMGVRLVQTSVSNTIIYIDTALSESGVVFKSTSDFITHLLNTRDHLRSIGLQLSVKLHPAHFETSTPNILKKEGIDICSNQEFIVRLKSAKAAIVEPSSASIIPALMGIPILLCQYGRLNGQAYGAVLTTYPRSRYLKNLSEIQSILDEEQKSLLTAKVYEWINDNSGPMPSEDMPKRVIDAMCQMLDKK